ncbi:thioesterase II family protein [Mesoterricola sediminis]|uniref:Thioesterase domain-containing protein n=1 Tax=Mesoterricola sediminis TaxID=2927980 RepID=A0AA48KF14_9BACT|nr:thioesterase domain-containing protein [Mesoterricola sediminis]BDU75998.1 hypothetical protein METESE_09560 [Mesoterricola sediminis]
MLHEDEPPKHPDGPRWIEIRAACGTGPVIHLPHAGSFALASRSMLGMLPAGCGLVAADYPDSHGSSPREFDRLCMGFAQDLKPHLMDGAVLLGASFGGYIAFQIARICEALLGHSFRRVVLVAVPDPRTLRNSLDDAPSWIATLLAREAAHAGSGVDPWVFEEMRSRIEKDLHCLRTLDPHRPEGIQGPLTIFNGEDDPWCDHRAAEDYWKQRSSCPVEYLGFRGRHLPGVRGWSRILGHAIRAGNAPREADQSALAPPSHASTAPVVHRASSVSR